MSSPNPNTGLAAAVQTLACAACGHEEANAALRYCSRCAAPLALNRTWLERANLDFLLGEIGVWKTAGLLPRAVTDELASDYAARLAVLNAPPNRVTAAPAAPPLVTALLDRGDFVPLDASAKVPVAATPLTPAPPVIPVPNVPPAPRPLAAFLEKNNIAALHLIGSLMILAGLVLLVYFQWGTLLGKGLLVGVLLLLTAGFYAGGRRLSREQPISGLVLSALGALVLPLNPVAWNVLGLFGGRLPWNVVGAVTGAGCAVVYAASLRRTRHPLFAFLVVVAGAVAALFAARLVLPGWGIGTIALAFVPLAALYFSLAHCGRGAAQTVSGNETPLPTLPFVFGGHVLLALTLARTLAGVAGVWGTSSPPTAALVLAGVAVIYGAVAVPFNLPVLAYAAAGAFVGAGQFALPTNHGGVTLLDRAVFLAITALLLDGAARLHRCQDEDGVRSTIAAVYANASVFAGMLAAAPAVFALTNGYARLRPPTNAAELARALVCLATAGWVLASAYRRERIQAALYAALGAGAFAVAALFLLTAPGGSRFVAGVPLLIFAALATIGARTLALRTGRENAAEAFDHAAVAALVLAALLPWPYFFAAPWNELPFAFGPTTQWLVLPGAAVLALVAAAVLRRNAANVQNGYVHAASGALGSLALLTGATLPFGGATFAALFGVGAAVALGAAAKVVKERTRPVFALDAAVLAGIASAALLGPTLLLFDGAASPLLVCAAWCALTLAWALAAVGLRAPFLLYASGGAGLLAARVAAGALSDWGAKTVGWEPNATRWLLVAVPIFTLAGWFLRERAGRARYARPLFHVSLAALVWAGLGQVTQGIVETFAAGAARVPASPTITLLLIAGGLAVFGLARQRKAFVNASVLAAVLGYVAFLINRADHAAGALVPVWVAALALGALGLAYLWTAWEHDAPGLVVAGGLAVFGGYAHALFALLPAHGFPAWPLALLPCFALLFAFGAFLGRDKDAAAAHRLRRPLDVLTLLLSLAALIVYGLTLRTGTYLTAAALAYAVAYFLAAWQSDEGAWTFAGAGAATAGALLRLGGYPAQAAWALSQPQTGFVLATLAGGWLGIAALFAAARRYALAEAMTRATLVCASAGALVALAGVTDPGQGRWTMFALAVTGTVYGVVGLLRGQAGWAHAAFGAYFAAFALLLYNGVGLSVQTADFYLIPVGTYLLAVGALVAHARPDAAGHEAARRLYALGLLLALAPTFLAAYLETAWWHAFLLAAECVAAVYAGIARRIRVFLSVGMGFLVALLAVKLRAPLGQINFGVYLTVVGAAVLASGYLFEKRREQVRAWARAARQTFDGWE